MPTTQPAEGLRLVQHGAGPGPAAGAADLPDQVGVEQGGEAERDGRLGQAAVPGHLGSGDRPGVLDVLQDRAGVDGPQQAGRSHRWRRSGTGSPVIVRSLLPSAHYRRRPWEVNPGPQEDDMAELALCGGAPVRPEGYPAWPVHDEGDVEAWPRSSAAAGAASPAGPAGRLLRRALRRLPGVAARGGDGQRHRDHGGRPQGARDRLGRRGHRPRTDLCGHAVRGHGGRGAPGLLRRPARHPDHRPRPG